MSYFIIGIGLILYTLSVLALGVVLGIKDCKYTFDIPQKATGVFNGEYTYD